MVVGFCCSAFDLLHAGHVMMLRYAKQRCSYLIAGLHIDPSLERTEKRIPVQSIVERYVQLAAVKYIDKIIPYSTEEDLKDILRLYQIGVRFVGEEYKNKPQEITGIGLSIRIIYVPRRHGFSTTNLRERIRQW